VLTSPKGTSVSEPCPFRARTAIVTQVIGVLLFGAFRPPAASTATAARRRGVLMAHPTYRVDFSRTDDHGHVIVGTASAGEQVTMVDDHGTSCVGTVVLHSPDCGILLIRPNPGTWGTAALVEEDRIPQPRPGHERVRT
jgi:hypothetical protein